MYFSNLFNFRKDRGASFVDFVHGFGECPARAYSEPDSSGLTDTVPSIPRYCPEDILRITFRNMYLNEPMTGSCFSSPGSYHIVDTRVHPVSACQDLCFSLGGDGHIVLEHPFLPPSIKQKPPVAKLQQTNPRETIPSSRRDGKANSLEQDMSIEKTKEGDKELGKSKFNTPQNQDARRKKTNARGQITMNVELRNNLFFYDVNPRGNLNDPFHKGVEIMGVGDAALAILYFEAALQRTPPYNTLKTAVIQFLLGVCQSANQDDVLAITTFRECLRAYPVNPNALMSLAVSYANEDQPNFAVETIAQWLCSELKYHEVVSTRPSVRVNEQHEGLDIQAHGTIQKTLLLVAHSCYEGYIDPNIHCAIGIMFCLVGNYSQAVESFNTCVMLCPGDERLWNHLGMCFANCDRHEEAINAYSNALKLVPGYVRAEFNWAISCSKLGDDLEAIKHLLNALNNQTKSLNGVAGKRSSCIWVYLRKLIMTLEEPQLVEAVEKRDLDLLTAVFKDE